jgi:HEAT repeat protein
VPALRRALVSPSDDAASLAAIALARLGPAAASAAEDLGAALRRGSVRRVAADALAGMGDAGRPVLERAAKDPDERVRAAATAALERSRAGS